MKFVSTRSLAALALLALASISLADPIKIAGGPVAGGGGTIKPTHGDDAGTLKGVVKLRLYNPNGGLHAPPQITMNFEIFTDTDDPRTALHYHLSGVGHPTPGKLTTWTIDREGPTLTLKVDGVAVDKVTSPAVGAGAGLVFTFESSTFDRSLYPYGAWNATMQLERGKDVLDPIVVVAPGPLVPIPVPKP